MNIKNYYIQTIGDMASSVAIYQRLRDEYPGSFLLESSDYRGVENSCSFVCLEPLAEILIQDNIVQTKFNGEVTLNQELESRDDFVSQLEDFYSKIKVETKCLVSLPNRLEKPLNGIFGYLTYESVQYFEDIDFKAKIDEERKIPNARYVMFRYVIQINHFRSEMFIQENVVENDNRSEDEIKSGLLKLKEIAITKNVSEYPFHAIGEEKSNFEDHEYLEMIEKCKKHIKRGDIFQIVPSRRFSQSYSGDDFQVYRTLRAINPSPYLFYFDCGSFRLFGSSPEALIVLKNGTAASFPIAGTYFRKGTEEDDREGAKKLLADEKENAEHVMLVDLARNDLSRLCTNVRVSKFKEVQFYSHVIHLVSKIEGLLNSGISPFRLIKAVFPHGTLSGAPKYRAMELIDEFERGHRSQYAGSVGFITFEGNVNHAIMIRSFLSSNNKLHYQAGGGVVADSDPESECMEVKNKLMALKKAIHTASALGKEV